MNQFKLEDGRIFKYHQDDYSNEGPIGYKISKAKDSLPDYLGLRSNESPIRVAMWEITLGGWLPCMYKDGGGAISNFYKLDMDKRSVRETIEKKEGSKIVDWTSKKQLKQQAKNDTP